jgi:hypothetical protein
LFKIGHQRKRYPCFAHIGVRAGNKIALFHKFKNAPALKIVTL